MMEWRLYTEDTILPEDEDIIFGYWIADVWVTDFYFDDVGWPDNPVWYLELPTSPEVK